MQAIKERRRSSRRAMVFPVAIVDGQGRPLTQGQSADLSRQGMLVSVPVKSLPRLGARVELQMKLPRQSPRHLPPDILGRVVRHMPLQDERLAGLAVEFDEPIDL